MHVTTARIIIFFVLVIGFPILVAIVGYTGGWLLIKHEDWLKKFKKVMEVLLYLVLYLGMCGLIAFGIGH